MAPALFQARLSPKGLRLASWKPPFKTCTSEGFAGTALSHLAAHVYKTLMEPDFELGVPDAAWLITCHAIAFSCAGPPAFSGCRVEWTSAESMGA